MTSSARISVIMPVYNAEKYLPAAVESVLGQVFGVFELILIDDGSTDASPLICDRFREADSRVKVIHKANAGVAAARNDGLDAAQGDYLMFCDSDDVWDPLLCGRMLEELQVSKADVVVCGVDFIREASYEGAVERADDGYCNPGRSGMVLLHPYDRLDKVNVMLWNKIFRMDLIRRYDIRFPEIREHEDDAFWFQYMMVAERAQFITARLYRYRLRDGSLTDLCRRGRPKDRNDRMAVVSHVIGFARRWGLAEEHRRFLMVLACSYYGMVRDLFTSGERQALRSRILAELSDLFTPGCLILEIGEALDVMAREPMVIDGLIAFWHWVRAGFAFSVKRRERRLYKARLHWIAMGRRRKSHEV